jgi:hypothetical protein
MQMVYLLHAELQTDVFEHNLLVEKAKDIIYMEKSSMLTIKLYQVASQMHLYHQLYQVASQMHLYHQSYPNTCKP